MTGLTEASVASGENGYMFDVGMGIVQVASTGTGSNNAETQSLASGDDILLLTTLRRAQLHGVHCLAGTTIQQSGVSRIRWRPLFVLTTLEPAASHKLLRALF